MKYIDLNGKRYFVSSENGRYSVYYRSGKYVSDPVVLLSVGAVHLYIAMKEGVPADVVESGLIGAVDGGQSKRQSHQEVIANQVIGILIGWCLVYWVLPLIGIVTTAPQATVTTMIFFVSSYTRAYVIRRWFNARRGRDERV